MLLPFLQEITEKILIQGEPASLSLFDMAMRGGILMIPLFLLSIIAVYIFAERWWAIRKASAIDNNFMNNIKDCIHDGRIDAAMELAKNADTPIAHLIEKGLSRLGRPLSDIREAVENTGNAEVARLERGLSMLASIAGGAPMIGFLGTVIGMIEAFYNMSSAGNNIDVSLLSGGIYTAMVTTVAGLIVGIIAYFGYNYLAARISKVVYKMDSYIIEFMDLLNEPVE
jgi:biopolymer transport protein ExbB